MKKLILFFGVFTIIFISCKTNKSVSSTKVKEAKPEASKCGNATKEMKCAAGKCGADMKKEMPAEVKGKCGKGKCGS